MYFQTKQSLCILYSGNFPTQLPPSARLHEVGYLRKLFTAKPHHPSDDVEMNGDPVMSLSQQVSADLSACMQMLTDAFTHANYKSCKFC
jgi:hypothetical protein